MVAGLWFHQLRAGSRSGGQWAALATHAGEAPAELGAAPSWARPAPPRASPANHRACAPTPSKTAKGALSRPSPPTSTDSWEAVPGRPTSLGCELLSPPLSLDPTQEAEPRLPSILGLGFLRSPPPPQQLTRPAQAPLLSCLLPCLALGDIEGLCPQLACLPAPRFWAWHS